MNTQVEAAGEERGEFAGALRAYLAEADVPCPRCGYNLRGLPGDSCPECRAVLRLTLEGDRRRYERLWKLSVAVVVLLAVLATVQVAYLLVAMFRFSWAAPSWFTWLGVSTPLLITAVAAVRVWRVRGDAMRGLLSAAIMLVTGIVLLALWLATFLLSVGLLFLNL